MELAHIFWNHENFTRKPIAEELKFDMQNCRKNEIIFQFMAEIETLSQYCEYGDSLEHMMRYRLDCGVNHGSTQHWLLSEGIDLTLQKALDISLSLESA